MKGNQDSKYGSKLAEMRKNVASKASVTNKSQYNGCGDQKYQKLATNSNAIPLGKRSVIGTKPSNEVSGFGLGFGYEDRESKEDLASKVLPSTPKGNRPVIYKKFDGAGQKSINKLPLITITDFHDKLLQKRQENVEGFEQVAMGSRNNMNDVCFPKEYSFLRLIKKLDLNSLRQHPGICKDLLQSIELPEWKDVITRQRALVSILWRQSEIEADNPVFDVSVTYLSSDDGGFSKFKLEITKRYGDKPGNKVVEHKSDDDENGWNGDIELESGTRMEIRLPKFSRNNRNSFFRVQIIEVCGNDTFIVKNKDIGNDLLRTFEEVKVMKASAHKICYDLQFKAAIKGMTCTELNNFENFIRPDKHARANKRLFEAKEAHKIIDFLKSYYQTNAKQAQSMIKICTSAHRKTPFVLYGPHGTGKSVAICKTVECLMKMNPKFRILICTSTNKLANDFNNYLTNRFNKSTLNENSVYRFEKHKSSKNSADFKLVNSNVVICSLNNSTHLVAAGIGPGYFSHILFDETSSMPFYDLFIPIGNFATKNTSIILSGDPFKMTPDFKLASLEPLASSISVLRHYLRMKCYDTNPDLSCLLTRGYAIYDPVMKVIGEAFYDDKNLFMGRFFERSDFTDSFLGNGNKEFPVMFINVNGFEGKPKDSKSHGNFQEALVVESLCNKLINEHGKKVKDIGIISPYSEQRKLLWTELDNKKRHPTDRYLIESVRHFRKVRRSIIILTTVRTKQVGFMGHLHRIYTAITCANRLLIVVGNEKTLVEGSIVWKRFINACKENGGFYQWSNGDLKVGEKKPDYDGCDAKGSGEKLFGPVQDEIRAGH